MSGVRVVCFLLVLCSSMARSEEFADPKRAFEHGIWVLETESLKPYDFVGRLEINHAELVTQSLRKEAEGYFVPGYGYGRWDVGWGVLLRAVVYTRPDGKSYLGRAEAIAGGRDMADALSRYYGGSRDGVATSIFGHSVNATEHLVWMSRKSVKVVENLPFMIQEAKRLRVEMDKSRPLPDRIYVAIRAFIPSKHPTRSDYISEARFKKGKYIFEGPAAASNLFRNRCYNTDDRGFSSVWDPSGTNVTSKIAIALELKVTHGALAIVSKQTPSASTFEYKCDTGEVTCEMKSDTSRTIVEPPVKTDQNIFVIKFSAASRNRCLLETYVAGDIDMVGEIKIDTALRIVEIEAAVDDFPSFEAYAGTTAMSLEELYTLPPAAGATVLDLIAAKPPRHPPSRVIRF
jgi:hypothetical protein